MTKDYVNIVTPKGVAVYPWLVTPDTKFNTLGEYKVNLSLDKDSATPLMKKIDEGMEKAKALIPEGKKIKESEPPYTIEETGTVVFKFKMKANIQTKDGRTIPMSPKLFDASGQLMTDVQSVYGGSEIKVSADMIPYYVATIGAGISLRLKAVQVINLITGGGDNAESYGFEKTEGYVSEKEQVIQSEFDNEQEDF